ncbi:3-hydroxydecanoyl-ACP dehydratase [Enterovibrio norvegicus]|uniref:hotdog family protein n=1 Tax=Enterovibrio norvegicus TaxID=188144 RepID=UPI0002D33EF3|nr:hotdog family protein [Enterovibrio norvegicus]MCC4800729.1 hotdog family protein [Enterovibrio norvegicus]OEF51187.1 3-hydroxydecanoyl-ACP dehydratase [Enterovibrio norvegicus]PMI36574.1 3-hydroxydecanoyl-ACP dehydratase [Enterovibrio norvegicus]PMN48661.1 3-hydroxydecanoyl-ACP dehydratase [Enterovibrio norvegicus]
MKTVPHVNDLLPHEAPMILIDDMIDVGEKHIHCRVTSKESNLFFDQEIKAIPGWVGIELMAQTIAAWSGYHAWNEGGEPPVGFLLGSRRYNTDTSVFPAGQVLDIHADHMMESNGMAVFACRIEHDGVELATAQLNAFVPPKEKLEQMMNRDTQ